MSETIIGACGIVCSKCEAFIATKNYDVALADKTAKQWAQQFAADIKRDDIWCTGCMTAGERKCCHCASTCDIKKCVAEKGLSTCADCGEYVCDTLEGFYKFFPGEVSPPRIVLDGLVKARKAMESM